MLRACRGWERPRDAGARQDLEGQADALPPALLNLSTLTAEQPLVRCLSLDSQRPSPLACSPHEVLVSISAHGL